jgi:hypothetical protein
LGLNC